MPVVHLRTATVIKVLFIYVHKIIPKTQKHRHTHTYTHTHTFAWPLHSAILDVPNVNSSFFPSTHSHLDWCLFCFTPSCGWHADVRIRICEWHTLAKAMHATSSSVYTVGAVDTKKFKLNWKKEQQRNQHKSSNNNTSTPELQVNSVGTKMEMIRLQERLSG